MALGRRYGEMDMEDMSGMSGMDMGSTGLFVVDNMKIARALWYIVAAITLVRGSRAFIDYARTRHAKRTYSVRSAVPSRPTNVFTQAYETVLTTFREMSYPALQPFKGRVLRSFTPPPLGQSLAILTYWMVILIMLWTNVMLGPDSSLYGYRWEKPAFRAGWVSITQVPLLYALSCKFNVISIVTGISYERLNWLHRWVSRTLFMTVIVHWAYFFHEWTLADFVQYQLQIMPMVKYGFGAWAVIGWMVLTGFGFFRDLCYELWVLQHIAGAGTLLWLLYVHVPSYARYNIWLAIAFVAFDRGARGLWVLTNNLHLKAFGAGGIGYKAEANALSNGYLWLKVKDVDFNWRPGQHVFLSIPTCGIFESHPFTIANTRKESNVGGIVECGQGSRDLDVIFKCQSGFTKRLQRRAQRQGAEASMLRTHRVFLSGPWGAPPLAAVERSNTLILIASSTGASYTVPLLEHSVKHAPFVQKICFYWIVRHASQISWHETRLRTAMQQLASVGVTNIQFQIFITGVHEQFELKENNISVELTSDGNFCHHHSRAPPSDSTSHARAVQITNNDGLSHGPIEDVVSVSDSSVDEKQDIIEKTPIVSAVSATSSSSSSTTSSHTHNCESESMLSSASFTYALGRPRSFDPLIRPAVEAALGETVVVACGGREMMAQVRNCVASLSDERAVHKGTGAQGIYLWTESYGW